MLRLIYVIVVNIFRIIYYVPKMSYYAKHSDRYSETERYALARRLVDTVIRTARADTEHCGAEDLPQSGGYIMFANHQGRYDPLGIISGHSQPCSFIVDKKRADGFLSKQFTALLNGISIDKESVKAQIRAIKTLSDRALRGERFFVFPEGVYDKNQGNHTIEFKEGCFAVARRAMCPIVPVTLIDSYKVFGINSLKRVTTKVVYHKPIPYSEYKDRSNKEIAELVKSIIDNEISARENR